MKTPTPNNPRAGNPVGSDVFTDPVAYLASFGIDSELIEVVLLPAAA